MPFDDAARIVKNWLLKFTKIWLQKSKKDTHISLKSFCAAMTLPGSEKCEIPCNNHAMFIKIPKSSYEADREGLWFFIKPSLCISTFAVE